MILYHGSTQIIKNPLVNVGRKNLDFGDGFYLTDIETQAIAWAARPLNKNKVKYINVYNLDIEKVKNDGFKYLKFDGYDYQWLDFIIANRRGENRWKDYDIIEGGIANDRVFNTIELYIAGLTPKEDALERLRYEKPNNQICILNQQIINKYLLFTDARELEDKNKTLIQMKYSRIVNLLAEKQHISHEKALGIFYNSDVYTQLQNQNSYLYNMSDAYIVDEMLGA